MKKKSVPSAKPFWYSYKTGQQYSKKATLDCEYFHSVLEFQLYTDFLRFIPKEQISRQVPLLYKPGTSIYPALAWKVDFAIRTPNEEVLFIEAKGAWILGNSVAIAEFQHKLQFLEFCNHQAWQNLFLVSPNEMKLDSFYKVLKPNELISILRLRMQRYTIDMRTNLEEN